MFLPNEGAWEGVFPQSALGYAQCLYHSTGLAEGSSSYFSGDAGCLWKGTSLSQDPQPGSRAFRSPTD